MSRESTKSADIKSTILGRRRLIQAGLGAVPVIVSLHARQAFAHTGENIYFDERYRYGTCAGWFKNPEPGGPPWQPGPNWPTDPTDKIYFSPWPLP